MTRVWQADYAAGRLRPGSPNSALALVALGATAISFASIFTKALVGTGMGPTPVAVWRVLGASLLLVGFALVAGWAKRLPRRLRLTVLIGGVFFAADLWVWHRSIVYVGAGMATILGNTQVFWSALIGRIVYGDRLGARFAVGAAAAFSGVVMLAGVGSQIEWTRTYAIGIGFGLATGLVYAVYILAVRHANKEWAESLADGDPGPTARAVVVLGWTLAVCGLVLAAAGGVEGELEPPDDGVQVLYLLGLALAVQIGGWLAISRGLPLVAAARGALVLLLQAALAAVWGALLFGESLEPLQLVGAVLTLGGVYLGSTRGR